MAPPTDKDEEATRREIDEKLIAAGWVIQDSDIILVDIGSHDKSVLKVTQDRSRYHSSCMCGAEHAARLYLLPIGV